MPDTEAVTKQIVGQCVEIEQKPGSEWVKFQIDVGSQYPIGLSTKLPELIEQARAVGGDVATWTFKQSDGNPNPNKPGTFYQNRWLGKVEPGDLSGNTASVTATASVPSPHHDALAPADKDRAITRMAILKAAAELFSGQGNTEVVGDGARDNVAELLAAADRMERWVLRDLQDVPFE